MNIRIAQINPIVGDISGNFELISKTIISSPEHSIVIFPELAITGYPPQDLLLNDKFIEANSLALNEIVKHVTAPAIIGYVRKKKSNLHNTFSM